MSRTRSAGLLAALALVVFVPDLARAGPTDRPTVSTAPGSVVRWSVPGTKSCGMAGRSWAPLGETCYYPIDLLRKPGVIEIARRGAGARQTARVKVVAHTYPTEELDLGDIPQGNPSAEDLERNVRDQAKVGKVWNRPEGEAKFTLPLGAPAKPLPEGKTFGWKRVFNGKPAAQPHMGADYALPTGTPLVAVADGTVVIAEDLFYPGQAVFLDHGDGLFTMYFHLSAIDVQAGQEVRKGDPIGKVGETGRATGPHLYFGVRWHKARIDPQFLLGDPARIPAVD